MHAETLYGGARGFSYLLNQLVTGRWRRERKREKALCCFWVLWRRGWRSREHINISRFHFAGCRRINFSAARQFLIAARGVKSPSRWAMAHFSQFYDQSECSCMAFTTLSQTHTFQSGEVRYVRSMHFWKCDWTVRTALIMHWLLSTCKFRCSL